MTQRLMTQARPWMMALALALAVVAGLTVGAQGVAAQFPSPPYAGPGEFCVDDAGYPGDGGCVANDTKISSLTPNITEVCLAVGDTATVAFEANLVIGATTRYDLAMYFSTNGGSARNGSSCVKDVLQPVAALNAPGDPMNPAGIGPFKNEDGDLCGEANSAVGAYYKLHPMTITCVDNNNDGVVDPISTCVSWANNDNQYNCLGVTATVPGPGTSSKCYCDTVAPNPPVLIYKGYDWGDLPDTYQTLLASNGPRHTIQDSDGNGAPNAQGGVEAVWLGSTVDFSPNGESNGQPSTNADGDDLAYTDDENGVTITDPVWVPGTGGGKFTVSVSTTGGTCSGCKLGFWIDWNLDGDFGEANEAYVQSVTAGSQAITFDPPLMELPSEIRVRFRLYASGYDDPIQPYGLVINGEVEDYVFIISPNAVKLSSFSATATKKNIVLNWETSKETNNLGFNVYRATAIDGERTKINAGMIPAVPGSATGRAYSYTDQSAKRNRTYYYWLEAVDIAGATELYGPTSAAIGKAVLDWGVN